LMFIKLGVQSYKKNHFYKQKIEKNGQFD
jgi:hypothetical protein